MNNCNKKVDADVSPNIKKDLIAVLFVKGITESITSISNNLTTTFDYRTINNLSKYIKVHKDITDYSHKNHVIYKINCKKLRCIIRRSNKRATTNEIERKC